jgi:FMN phosphatase YigB (HAD superfamily)
MIKNIVFDLGNVLISFRPADYISRNNYSPEKRKAILSDIFCSREWLLLDDGEITTEQAIDDIAMKSSLKRDEIARIFNERTRIFYTLDKNAKILPELKKQGFKLYYISNFPGDIFDDVKKSYQFFKYFDGGIISAHVKCSKPSAEIFRIFLDKYNLVAEECLYIDDIEKNVTSAMLFGMKGFITHGSNDFSGEITDLLQKA